MSILRHPVGRYGFAAVATGLAVLLRLPLRHLLTGRVPFGFSLFAVLLTAWLVGTGPAIVALLLGLAASILFVITPHGSVLVNSLPDLVALGVYATVGGVAILLFARTRSEHDLAEDRARENAELAARVREASKQKDHFLALLAHELRNPLAPIRTGLDILDRSPDEPTAIEVRQKVRRQIEQLIRIVDDLLDVSRFVRGKVQLKRETLDIREVVDLSIETLDPVMRERDHEVSVRRPPRPVWVNGDRLRLVQVVSNLLSNAGKYTPEGGRIRIDMHRIDGEVHLHVVDNGMGIPDGQRDAIFHMFARAHAPTTRDHGGLGLGLAIVHGLIELHGGRVWAESDGEGLGSRFVVAVPESDAPPTAVDETETDAEAVAAENAEATRRAEESEATSLTDTHTDIDKLTVNDTIVLDAIRVMVVDDNLDAAETLGKLIALEGCAVRVLDNGPSALAELDAFNPHVVLLDIGMPGMDGYEVARRIVESKGKQRPRLIAVTGWGGPEDRRRSADAGFDHHFVKPVATNALLGQLRPKFTDPSLSDSAELEQGVFDA